jgi:hypothetical protein
MKRLFCLFTVYLFFLPANQSLLAQNSFTTPIHKVAIFAPLYLDSAFDATSTYRYDETFPKFIIPGLEFYEGAQLAIDSLAKENMPLEVFVYDTRSAKQTINQQLEEAVNNHVELMLAYCSGSNLGTLAYTAALKKIPFINVNLPVDGGVYNNPYFVILNPTLKTHIESIYHYIQKKYPVNDIIVFRKKGRMENLIKNYFDEAGKNTVSVPLKLQYVDLPDSFTTDMLKAKLNGSLHNLCIAGSLDENFGKRLVQKLAPLTRQYQVALMGMPTYDNLTKDFSKPDYKGLEIIYSTPFYNDRTDTVSQYITNFFNTNLYARPSDLVMRGYETTWRFSKLLVKYKGDLASNLSRKEFDVFHQFDIQPVINKKNMTLDYFENQKLYFVKWLDGTVKTVE